MTGNRAPNPGPAESYAAISKQVELLLAYPYQKNPNSPRKQRAYMIMRAAALIIAQYEGQARAAELIYRLADELAIQEIPR